MFFKRLKRWVILPLIILTCLLSGVAAVGQNVYADDGAADDSTKVCESAAGAASLGWVVCPILRLLADGAERLYDDWIEPALQTDPQLFDNGVPESWETFRNAANVLLSAMFLFVIFSQVSGIGIDNYGIKSMLPKMIAAAVLVNISYWLCIVCVDLSNIIGSSLKNMFDGMATGGGSFSLDSAIGSESVSVEVAEGQFASVAALVAVVGLGVSAIWANPAIVMSLLISALGLIVSIFGLFVLLLGRQAIIVGLVALSPIALACYMMPNTKRVMDKWLSIFEAMLLVYPICGFLVGGGNWLSRLILQGGIDGGGDMFKAFGAMIIGIAPIFLIPTVLTNAMSATGSLGAKLMSAGSAIGGKITGAAQNSSVNQAAQRAGAERKASIAAGLQKTKDASGNVTYKQRGQWGGKVGQAVRRANQFRAGGITRAEIGDARSQVAGFRAAAARRDRMLDDERFEAVSLGQKKAEDAAEIADYETLYKDTTRNGGNAEDSRDLRDPDQKATGVHSMFDDYMTGTHGKNKNTAGAVTGAKYAGRRKDTAASFAKHFTDGVSSGAYDIDMTRSVAKEMTTGDNSGNYMASNPFAFQYANDLNSGKAVTGEGANARAVSFSDWIQNSDNVDGVIDNYITDSGALVGMKGSTLRDLKGMMDSGQVSSEKAGYLKELASKTVANQGTTGVWDESKKTEIEAIANWTPPAGGAAANSPEVWQNSPHNPSNNETPIQTGAYSTLRGGQQASTSTSSSGGSGTATTTAPPAGGSTTIVAASPSGSGTENSGASGSNSTNPAPTPTHNVSEAINGTNGSTRVKNGGNVNDLIRGEAKPGSGLNGGGSDSGGSVGSDGTTLDIHH